MVQQIPSPPLSSALVIVLRAVPRPSSSLTKVFLRASRLDLAKRRWRVSAQDGAEFGFDLESPLHDGDVVLETPTAQYVLVQGPEPLLQLPFRAAGEAAHLAWSLGNLHFPVEISANAIRVSDDPAVRLFLEREKISAESMVDVFHPIIALSSGHSHGHQH